MQPVSYTHLDVYKRQVQEAQENDKEWLAWGNNPTAAATDNCWVDNGLVWKDRCHHELGLRVLPDIRMEIIRQLHDDPDAGHLRTEEMFQAIGKAFV